MKMMPLAGESAAPTNRSSATITIRIQRIEQLLDAAGPSPFRSNETAVRSDAESYIMDAAADAGHHEPLRLLIHAPVSIKPHSQAILGAIHAHFERARVQCQRRYQRRMHIGRGLLVMGISVLGSALLLRALLGDPGDRATVVAASEGLLILGWVALWRPLEILLFERLENHQQNALLKRLARIPVDFEFDAVN